MHGQTKISPKSWLAFDLNILRRLEFRSAAIPFTNQPELGTYLKRWNVRVAANDPLQSAWIRNLPAIANTTKRLSESELQVILEDAYVPRYQFQNPALVKWFGEVDAWWFDNVRRNIDQLTDEMSKAIALSIGIAVGDYALSFRAENRELRQPLSVVYKRLWSIRSDPFDNGQANSCHNLIPDDFIAETPAELMFLRLPTPHVRGMREQLGRSAWREEWLRVGEDFWQRLEAGLSGKLGAPTETKSQYVHLLENTLQRASHIKNWAIAHVENGFIQTQDIVDAISEARRVNSIYTKDFSELTGAKAVIITA